MIFRHPYYNLILAVVVAFGAFLLESIGAFHSLDGVVYDNLTILTPEVFGGDNFSGQFMIIEGNPEDFYNAEVDWNEILKRILGAEARQVVFYDIPATEVWKQKIEPSLKDYPNVWLASHEATWFGPGARKLNSSLALEKKIILPDLTSESGNFRDYPAVIEPMSGLRLETGPLKLARQEKGVAGEVHPPNHFRISFIGKSQGLPRTTLKEFLDPEFPLRLLKDRRIWVGMSPREGGVKMYTPLSLTDSHLTPVEYHCFAWGALLTGEYIVSDIWWLSIVLIMLPGLATGMLAPKLSGPASLWAGALIPVVIITFCWICLVELHYWPPFSALIGSQALIFGGVFHRKSVLQEASNQELLEETSLKMREKALPEEFLLSEDRWTQIANTLSQILGWSSCAALEWESWKDRKKLRILAVSGRSKSSINLEKIEAALKAIRSGELKLEDGAWANNSLVQDKDLPSKDKQFLTPLFMGGEILGAWVFTSKSSSKSHFEADWKAMEQSMATEMSELLEARYLWLRRMEEEQSKKRFWRAMIRGDLTRSNYEEIQRSFKLLDNRRLLLNQVFNSLDTAAILYDWFGNVVQINDAMTDQLKTWGLAPFQLTAVDMLRQLTDKTEAEAREYFRIVMQRKETVSISVQLGAKDSPLFLLLMRPVNKSSAEGSLNSVGLFSSEGLMGLLFELLDISRLKRLFRLKDMLFKHSNIRIRQDLETLVLGLDTLNQPELDNEERLDIAVILEEKTMDMVGLSKSIDDFLDLDVFTRPLIYPAPANVPLKEAMDQVKSWMEMRGLEWKLHEPTMPQLVLADYDELTQLFCAIFKILIDDATAQSSISVNITEEEGSSVLCFSNEGFGMPGAILQESLHGERQADSSFDGIRSGIQLALEWGGSLSCESEIGQGFRFKLKLKRV